MLVYGDPERTIPPADILASIDASACRAERLPSGILRHGEIVTAFIEASQLAQGIADADFAARGHDARSHAQDAGMALVMELAEAVRVSWDSDFEAPARLPLADLQELSRLELPATIRVKLPEGYAFYALYPEAYLEAAKALDPSEPTRVIGIRSIGAGLAALVAARTGAPPPWTVRPCGHPFGRRLSLAPELAAEFFADPMAQMAVVDEGPGFSGSSFGAVLDALEDGGITRERLHVFPSHAGDLGPQASPRHRERWGKVARHTVTFDALVLGAENPAHRLESWVRDLVGEANGPLEDISGGAWRPHRFSSEADWPAAHVQQERRKFLLRAGGGPAAGGSPAAGGGPAGRATWLLKFAGLGREGAHKLKRAQALHAAGFTPEVLGLRHGFLVERWVEDARPLDLGTIDRTALVDRVGRYLAARARFTARPEQGASLASLLAMARHNAGQALGEDAAQGLERWAAAIPELEARVRPIETDNRMHAWEWLQDADGRLVKTDALDHHAAHDLVGCQDMAWDVAGATIELGLEKGETAALAALVGRETGRPVDRELLALLTLCYLAFQLGHCALGAEALGGWPAEADRLRAAAQRYADHLRRLLR